MPVSGNKKLLIRLTKILELLKSDKHRFITDDGFCITKSMILHYQINYRFCEKISRMVDFRTEEKVYYESV